MILFVDGIHHCFEGFGVVHRQIGKYLAIELDIRRAQLAHQNRIRDSVLAGTSIDTLNPQPPEIALFDTAVSVSV